MRSVLTFGSLCASAPLREHFHSFTLSSRSRLLVVPLLAALAGCDSTKSSVTGAVTLDGEPVRSGSIAFVKTEGDLAREGAVIQDGKFHAVLPPGKYKIELNAQKVVGTRKQKGFDGAEEVVELTDELFPPRYNSNTELIEVIKPGANTLNFDLKGEK
jgi:hypothetical protein